MVNVVIIDYVFRAHGLQLGLCVDIYIHDFCVCEFWWYNQSYNCSDFFICSLVPVEDFVKYKP